MSKKAWIILGTILSIILLSAIATGGVIAYKTHQADNVADAYHETSKKAENGKLDSIKKLKDSKTGDNMNNQDALNQIVSNPNDIYGQYAGVDRVGIDDINNKMYDENGNISQKYKDIVDKYCTGHIEIPSLNLNLPIIEGTSDNHLWAGATTYRPHQTLSKGNFILLSHNVGYDNMLFSDLPKIQKGAKVKVVSYAEGHRQLQNYKVDEIKVVNENDGHYLDKTDDKRLTLITCDEPNENAKNRVIVIAKPI